MDGINSKFEIKGMKLKNRIVMPPMATEKATEKGKVRSALIEHYRERQGVGMIIVEHSYVAETGKNSPCQLGIYDDGLVPGLSDLAHALHIPTGIQINHSGGNAMHLKNESVSEVAEVVHDLRKEEIQEIIDAFAEAAIRVKKAGFEFVEIHGAHGFLLTQFYSPLTNKREDEYGGSRKNRLRLPLKVVHTVREAVGEKYPIAYRLGACDGPEGGLTIEDGVHAARKLVDAGVDILDISGGHGGFSFTGRKEHYFVPAAAKIKEAANVPIIVTGGIRDPLKADMLIKNGKTDLIGVGRPLLKDPNWPENALETL
ncbi:MAG: NADH:flavin oxidoreductase [Euryarchaeota archaeon]|nr:NADH:flavin oxidoreductase [Euryarchaeota archaeon]